MRETVFDARLNRGLKYTPLNDVGGPLIEPIRIQICCNLDCPNMRLQPLGTRAALTLVGNQAVSADKCWTDARSREKGPASFTLISSAP